MSQQVSLALQLKDVLRVPAGEVDDTRYTKLVLWFENMVTTAAQAQAMRPANDEKICGSLSLQEDPEEEQESEVAVAVAPSYQTWLHSPATASALAVRKALTAAGLFDVLTAGTLHADLQVRATVLRWVGLFFLCPVSFVASKDSEQVRALLTSLLDTTLSMTKGAPTQQDWQAADAQESRVGCVVAALLALGDICSHAPGREWLHSCCGSVGNDVAVNSAQEQEQAQEEEDSLLVQILTGCFRHRHLYLREAACRLQARLVCKAVSWYPAGLFVAPTPENAASMTATPQGCHHLSCMYKLACSVVSFIRVDSVAADGALLTKRVVPWVAGLVALATAVVRGHRIAWDVQLVRASADLLHELCELAQATVSAPAGAKGEVLHTELVQLLASCTDACMSCLRSPVPSVRELGTTLACAVIPYRTSLAQAHVGQAESKGDDLTGSVVTLLCSFGGQGRLGPAAFLDYVSAVQTATKACVLTHTELEAIQECVRLVLTHVPILGSHTEELECSGTRCLTLSALASVPRVSRTVLDLQALLPWTPGVLAFSSSSSSSFATAAGTSQRRDWSCAGLLVRLVEACQHYRTSAELRKDMQVLAMWHTHMPVLESKCLHIFAVWFKGATVESPTLSQEPPHKKTRKNANKRVPHSSVLWSLASLEALLCMPSGPLSALLISVMSTYDGAMGVPGDTLDSVLQVFTALLPHTHTCSGDCALDAQHSVTQLLQTVRPIVTTLLCVDSGYTSAAVLRFLCAAHKVSSAWAALYVEGDTLIRTLACCVRHEEAEARKEAASLLTCVSSSDHSLPSLVHLWSVGEANFNPVVEAVRAEEDWEVACAQVQWLHALVDAGLSMCFAAAESDSIGATRSDVCSVCVSLDAMPVIEHMAQHGLHRPVRLQACRALKLLVRRYESLVVTEVGSGVTVPFMDEVKQCVARVLRWPLCEVTRRNTRAYVYGASETQEAAQVRVGPEFPDPSALHTTLDCY